ncbi:hypothetical protein TPAR_07246 [Tolypocladium paradoxum]|uniref:Uncharacterized protein n=1 Tax=Tolypocladium paradoxum TaxID=94208 RepID=A0A2S4KQU4_9HYPO|nr:hypothetical protein TPAR_07246 [Tolypocladium paradoxum]
MAQADNASLILAKAQFNGASKEQLRPVPNAVEFDGVAANQRSSVLDTEYRGAEPYDTYDINVVPRPHSHRAQLDEQGDSDEVCHFGHDAKPRFLGSMEQLNYVQALEFNTFQVIGFDELAFVDQHLQGSIGNYILLRDDQHDHTYLAKGHPDVSSRRHGNFNNGHECYLGFKCWSKQCHQFQIGMDNWSQPNHVADIEVAELLSAELNDDFSVQWRPIDKTREDVGVPQLNGHELRKGHRE